ncbi:MAG: class I adenylate-forming enzyme family protein [Ktedonobacteraceae bacterium]
MSTIDALLAYTTRASPDHVALTLREHDMSYRDLSAAVERLASRLSTDIAPGQRVAIVVPNVPALVIGMFATWHLGGVAVPLNARYREYELRRILQDAQPTLVISVTSYRGYPFAELLPTLLPHLPTVRRCVFVDSMGEVEGEVQGVGAGQDAALAETHDPEIGLILYTSGSTGAPKGALIKHMSEVEGARAMNDVLGATPEDVCIFVIPLSHAFGLMCFIATVASGGHAVLVESTFSSEPVADALRRHSATILHGPPALFTSLLKSDPACLGPVRTGYVAGAPCPPQVLEQLDTANCRILNLYGMTEIGAATCCRADDSPGVRYTTVGRPLPGYELRIVNSEVQVRGPYVTTGYYRQPEQTAAAFDDGWLRTGDRGSMDAQGNLSIAGRAKDMICVAGLSVFPAEVESFLLTHPDVVQAAIVGVPHASMGEVLQAFIVARPGSNLTPTMLLQFARARIAGYKLPYAIRMVSELPMLAAGKPDRVALAQMIQEETYADPHASKHPAL